MRRITSQFPLRWTLRQIDKKTGKAAGEEIPAEVPGDVFSDLLRAGIIPDPYIGLNSEKVQWVNNRDWLYRGVTGGIPSDGRTWIEFPGLDYRYAVSWNGRGLSRREGMFSRLLLEVVPRADGQNLVEVLFAGIPDRRIESRLPPLIVNTEPVRRRLLKTPMSFGWDFAPRLKGCGIRDHVLLFPTGAVLIDDLCVRAEISGAVEIELVLDSSKDLEAVVEIGISGEGFPGHEKKESVKAKLGPGKNRVGHRLKISEPRLWWPWDQGSPDRCRVSAAVAMGGKTSDAAEELFGFREVGWERNPHSPKSALDWTLLINGRRVFMRGANFIPPDSMPGRLTNNRCEKLIEMAKGANLNTLRFWGGGGRLRDEVYDACDRLGVMVWQEFPIACINLGLPRSKKYLALLEQECEGIVRQLRNRPAVIMWCGGNEFNVRLSRPALARMKSVCGRLDPTRRFVPASPCRGDAHNWLVWHLKGNLSNYFDDRSQLVSEFGLQAPPDLETLKHFLPGGLLWPVGKGWTHHHLSLAKMEKYLRHFGGPVKTIEDFISAGQDAQAHYLHRAIEHWRRQKYAKSGAMFWQWNDPWPCVSWSVVDYFLRPKKAYEAVRLACRPILVSAEFEQRRCQPGDRLEAEIFVVNDLPKNFPTIEVEVMIGDRTVKTMAGSAGADEVADFGLVSLDLPGDQPPLLSLVLKENGRELARNHYDLSRHDPEPAGLLARRLVKRWWWFLGG